MTYPDTLDHITPATLLAFEPHPGDVITRCDDQPWSVGWTVLSCVLARLSLPNRIRGKAPPTVALYILETHKPQYEHRAMWLSGDAVIEVQSKPHAKRERWSLSAEQEKP